MLSSTQEGRKHIAPHCDDHLLNDLHRTNDNETRQFNFVKSSQLLDHSPKSAILQHLKREVCFFWGCLSGGVSKGSGLSNVLADEVSRM